MPKFLLLFLFLFITLFTKGQPSSNNNNPIKKITKSTKIDAKKLKERKKKKKKSKKDLEKEELLLSKSKKAPVYQAPPSLMYKPIVRNGKKLTGSISTQQGFRICIYDGNKREEAFAAKKKFMQNNTELRSYLAYNRPYYKIKVGDFQNKKVAQKEFKKITELFPHAFITPDIVTVKSFKVNRNTRRIIRNKPVEEKKN